MELDINQRKIALGHKYDVYKSGVPVRYAHSKLMRFLSRIEMSDVESGRVLLTIAKRFSFLISYDIEFPNGERALLRTVSVWRGHYQCAYNRSIYDIYSHHKRKHSVYRNGSQVAWWEQAPVSWYNGDNYRITADDDCEQDVITAFCLIMDDATTQRENGSTLTFHVGHIGPEARPFNPMWTPRTVGGITQS